MWNTDASFTRKPDQSRLPTCLLQTDEKTHRIGFNAKYHWHPNTTQCTRAKINRHFAH